MTGVKTAWRKTWLTTIVVASLVGLGASGCDLGSKGVESNRSKTAATATQTPAGNKATEAAPEKKTEVAETTATSGPAPRSDREEQPEKNTKSKGTDSSSSGKGKARYKNCEEAKEAGAAPLYRGDPGYSPKLDRDGDGVACEK